MTLLLIIVLSAFIEPGAMSYFMVQPGDTILALNHMSNVTYQCTCMADDECTNPPYWSLENGGRHFVTNDNHDRAILAKRGITYHSSGISAVISIPNTVENNNTQIFCAGFISGGVEFSDPPVKLIIIGPPLPPRPVLNINSPSQLKIQWNVPYSHQKYPVVSYNIQIVNMSSGGILESLQEYNETSYVYTFNDDVQYCQIFTVNITAVSTIGTSVPGSVSRGFPIAHQPFQLDVIVEVTFPSDSAPMANISFMAPPICDHQTANYILIIQDTTNAELQPLVRQSIYTGSNGSVMEIIASGLQINHNYTLIIYIVEEESLDIEESTAVNFTTLIPHKGAASADGLSLGMALMCLIIFLCISHGIVLMSSRV